MRFRIASSGFLGPFVSDFRVLCCVRWRDGAITGKSEVGQVSICYCTAWRVCNLIARDDPESRAARKAFADAFRQARIEAGLTQAQAAVAVKASPSHISAIENEKLDPTLSTAARLAMSVGKVLDIRLIDPPKTSRKRKL